MMMMLQNQMATASAANGGINLTFAPEVGGALPSRPDVGVRNRAPGADRGHQPSDKVAEPSDAAEDMPDIEGDPLAQLNANMKENDLARKEMQPEKRKHTNKASEIRKAAKKSAGPTGGATDGEAAPTLVGQCGSSRRGRSGTLRQMWFISAGSLQHSSAFISAGPLPQSL